MENRTYNLGMLHDKLMRKAKAQSMLQELSRQLPGLREEEQRLSAALKKENADVERMEQGGLTAMFYELINKRGEITDREKAEAYAAAVRHSAAARQLEAAEHDCGSLKAELEGLSGIEEEYAEAFAAKEAELKARDPERGARICALEEKLDFLRGQEREIDEAAAAGGTVLEQIASIEAELDSADGWGTLDLFGGGFISYMEKHSSLDEAQEQINELQVLLQKYNSELADVKIEADVRAQTDDFLRFADLFFDGLFADWAVLDGIHDSQSQILAVRGKVEDVQNKLEGMKKSVSAEAVEVSARLDEIVHNA